MRQDNQSSIFKSNKIENLMKLGMRWSLGGSIFNEKPIRIGFYHSTEKVETSP